MTFTAGVICHYIILAALTDDVSAVKFYMVGVKFSDFVFEFKCSN